MNTIDNAEAADIRAAEAQAFTTLGGGAEAQAYRARAKRIAAIYARFDDLSDREVCKITELLEDLRICDAAEIAGTE